LEKRVWSKNEKRVREREREREVSLFFACPNMVS
jgi:hypothetical protein